MEDNETISAFMESINEIVLGIQCCGGSLSEGEIVSKVLRYLPPTYKMKVIAINELRIMPNASISRDTLVGKFLAFELEEFGPIVTIKIDIAFKVAASSLSSNKPNCKALYAKEIEEMRKDEELEELEALFARKMPRGPIGSKYEGKAPFKCFNCNKVGHVASRCLDQHARLREEAKRSYKPNPRYRFKKDKNKSCYYIHEGVIDFDEDPIDNGWAFVAIKEDQLVPIVKLVE